MGAQAAASKGTWVGWLVVFTFAFLFLYVRVTGHGLGDMPSVPPPTQPQAPAATPDPGAASGGATPISNVAVGSIDWLAAEFRHLGVLTAEERFLTSPSEAWPNCKLVILGPAGAYHGRVCESTAGLYRMNSDGTDSGLRWRLDPSGQWTIQLPEAQQASH